MNQSKKIAKIAGILFLTVNFTSLLGGGLIESIIDAPNYLAIISAKATQITIGFYLELINGIAVVGLAAMLFPILKKHNEYLSRAFIVFRIIESIFCIVSSIIPILLLLLIKEVVKSGGLNDPYIQTLGNLLIAARSFMTSLLIPVFFCLGALLFYNISYQSKLIPRYISVWGIIGVVLILIVNLAKIDISIGLFLALPIILNELFLGIWLIVKGFNTSPTDSRY